MIKYRRFLYLSFIVSISIVLISPSQGKSYGLPFNWVIHHGPNKLTTTFLLFLLRIYQLLNLSPLHFY